MSILVTGVNGQLGHDIVRKGLELNVDIIGIGRSELDITKKDDVSEYIKRVNPSMIIHCAAYTAVDNAEDDKKTCWNVNVSATEYLADAAKTIGAKFLYVSTDYVFDGKGVLPFQETDKPNPVSTYGISKYEGEKKVQNILEKYFIVRISWVFGVNGSNFIQSMLKLSETKTELNIVEDQIGSPTYTYDLAELLIEMVQSDKFGIYHASNEGYCSWAEFAEEIFNQADIDVKVNPINSEEYPTKAERPKNSRLSKKKLIENGFQALPTWQEAVQRYLNELSIGVK